MDRELAKELQRDFVPGGGPVDASKLVFRRTKPMEVFRCCCSEQSDPQSGMIFCGRVADYVHEEPDGSAVAACDQHARRLNIRIQGEA